jgi:flagellar secretion chaperone FliS
MSQTQTNQLEDQETAHLTGTRLVILMYDGAIGALNKALAAMKAGDLMTRCEALNMVMDIIVQLDEALDLENGGHVAANLDNLYRFMITRLARANLTNDPQPVRDVLKLLEPLYDAWRRLDEQITAQDIVRRGQAAAAEMRAAG